MSLDVLANYAEIAGALTIVGGAIFGLFQLSEIRKQRRGAVVAELMRTFYNPELSSAMALIRSLPDSVTGDELRERGPEYERAAVIIATSYETIAVLVFRRFAPFDLVEELAGGVIVVMWRKLQGWLEAVRVEQSQPSWAEWFQWLAERLSERETDDEPAYTKHASWRP